MRKKTGSIEIARQPRRSGVAGLYSVPRLEEVAADPGKLWMVDALTRRALTTTALAALNALFFHELAEAAKNPGSEQRERRDRLLSFKEAAVKLGTTLDWLYHHHKRLPFTVRLCSSRPRFSENAIEDYIRKHRII
jgi:predicted DNA-binding transcriptional regulator AlpA